MTVIALILLALIGIPILLGVGLLALMAWAIARRDIALEQSGAIE